MDDFLKAVTSDKELTPEQKEKIEEFRERMSPALTPEQEKDSFLVRWLIARNYDIDRSEEMLTKHINFVKINGLENVTEDFVPNEVVDYFYTAMLGYDEDGSVVRLLNIGACDLFGLCSSISKIDTLRTAYYLLANDAIKQRNERINDKICEKQVYILDLQGLSWTSLIQRLVVNRAISLLRSYEANHPERLKVAYVVNAPSFFSIIYSWLKSILPESILTKVEVVSTDQCESVLTKHIDPSILPASMGGTRTDPDGDPDCKSLYAKPLGTPVPDDFKLMNHHDSLSNDPEARKITIEYRALFIAEKLVSQPSSVLQWDFQTVDYDIRVGLRYKQDEDAEPVVIIPVHAVDCHLIPESGQFLCQKPGIYELVFDNSYSWVTRKELTFKIKLLMPNENTEK